MLSISTCPRCQRQVSIPAGVDSAMTVRCPLCDAEYALSEALVLAPPELIPVASAAGAHIEEDEAAAVARRMPMAMGTHLRRPKTSWFGRTVGLIVAGLIGCLVAMYGLALVLGPKYHRTGLPERIHIGDLIDVPLPFMAWLTTPATKTEKRPEKPREAAPPPLPTDPRSAPERVRVRAIQGRRSSFGRNGKPPAVNPAADRMPKARRRRPRLCSRPPRDSSSPDLPGLA